MELVKCPRGPIFIVVSATFTPNTSVFAGQVVLAKPLFNILSFQLISAHLNQPIGTPVYTSPTSGIMAVSSNRLGARIIKNPFQLGVSIDAMNQNTNGVSTIIGLTTTPPSAYVPLSRLNPEMKFNRSTQIDNFDWSVSSINGSFTTSSPSTIDLVFAFHPACDCNPF